MQPTTQEEILGKLKSCVNVLKGDLESITRVGKEIFFIFHIYFKVGKENFFIKPTREARGP